MDILRFLPLSYLSWFVGFWANLPLPQPLARWTILVFARAYGIDPTQASRPLETFRSIGEFFTRDLKPELRPILADCVFPVDGTLRSCEDLTSDCEISQVKGKSYSLRKLLGDDEFVQRLSSGQLWNMYLSPRDAHHIYAPVSGKIVKTVHIPGALWPVNDWALHSIDGLFAVNERVVTFIESEFGLVAVVMIGATNVGKISLAYTALETNVRPWEKRSMRTILHSPTVSVACGEKIGTFKMGSSVILITETRRELKEANLFPKCVQYGAALC
jgi:phosphatidylserine decarboxylase